MPDTTRLSLITRIGESRDSESWAEFVNLYGPFVYAVGQRHGLQDADACDLVQDVMREVSGSIGRFVPDPEMGRFRGWLGVITRRMLGRVFEKSRRQINSVGGTTNNLAVHTLPKLDDERVWEQEYQRQVFRWAADRVRNDFSETTWRAFWLTAIDGVAVQQAADECGVTVGAVYIAKSRVVKRLREKTAEAIGSDLL